MDDPDKYLRNKLYQELQLNVTLPESKLLLSAMLSDGKPLTWWRGIVNETIDPLDIKEHLHLLIKAPEQYQICHDERIFAVLRDETFKILGKPTVPIDVPALLLTLTESFFLQVCLKTS